MAKLRLTLLGGFEARTDSGFALAISLKKAQMLLAYLAMHPRQTHLRDKLATLLWDDSPTEQARHSLRQTFFAIRQALPFDPLLLDGDSVAFAAEAVTVDVTEFEHLAGTDDPERLERAATLYQGDLLEGISAGSAPFEEWLRAERERLYELALEGLARLLGLQMKEDAVEPAIRTALQLLTLDPLQEVTHRALMRLYTRQGRRAAALHQYQVCVDVLRRELGVEPEEATRELYQTIVPNRGPMPISLEPVATTRTRAGRRDGLRRRRRAPSLEAPLIGREAELGQLRQILRDVWRRRGTVLALVGEAGVGKTRVVEELSVLAGRRGGAVLVGRAYESAQVFPFSPWVDALRCDPRTTQRLVDFNPVWRAELARLLPEFGASAPTLATNDALALFEAVTQLMTHLATRQPVVLILEDLHWADEMTLRLLAFLGRRIQSLPVLTVTTAREEELSEVPLLSRSYEELSGNARLVRLPLSPLSRRDTASLVSSLAGASAEGASLERLHDHVWRVSEGNPFLVVEMLRGLREDAVPAEPLTPPLPKRVRELVAARLARLSERSQHVVSVASVIGREFDFDLLQRAAGLDDREAAEAVEALVRRRVVHGVGERLDFIHDRIREVACGELLPAQRRSLHRVIAQAMEQVYARNLEPHYAALGVHSYEGELWEHAVPYLRQAGRQSMWRSAYRQAAAFYSSAVKALARLPESREALEAAIDLRFGVRHALSIIGELKTTLDHLLEAEALARKLQDQRRLGFACAYLSACFRSLGDLERAVEAGDRALPIATAVGDLHLEVETTSALGQAYLLRGDYRRARLFLARGVADLEHDRCRVHSGGPSRYLWHGRPGHTPRLMIFRFWLATCFAELGEHAEAIAFGEQSVQEAEVYHETDSEPVTYALLTSGVSYLRRGDLGAAIPLLERALVGGRRADAGFYVMSAAGWAGHAYTLAGRVAEAIPLLEEAVAWTSSRGYRVGCALVLRQLSEARLLTGRVDEAKRLAEQSLELALECKARAHEAWTHKTLGEIVTSKDPIAEEHAERHYGHALEVATELGMRPLIAHCHLGLGKLDRRTGKRDQAREHLTTARTMYREMGMTYWLETAEAELKE